MSKHVRAYSIVTALCAVSLCTANASEGNTDTENVSYEQVAYRGDQAKLGAATKSKATNSSKNKAIPEMFPSSPCPDHWRISGDFLYLMPTLDDTYYVLQASTVVSSVPVNAKRLDNDFHFHPGFRAGLEYAWCDTNRELQIFYSWLSPEQSRTVSGEHLYLTVGIPGAVDDLVNYTGTAKSTLDLLYQRLDINISQKFFEMKGLSLYAQPGVELAYLRLDEDYVYASASTTVSFSEKSKVLGLGPQMGLAMDYNFYHSALTDSVVYTFSFTGSFSAGILVMEQAQRTTQSAESTVPGIVLMGKDEKGWRMVPALHAKAGLEYTARGSSVGFSLGAGYEFNNYIRGLSRVIYPSSTAVTLSETNYYDFDTQGLYVSAAFSF